MMRTSNPALNANVFSSARGYDASGAMTIQGAVNKTFILLFILVFSASWVWRKLIQPTPLFGEELVQSTQATVMPYMMFGLWVGLIVGFVTIFKKEWSAVTAPIYAVCEGFLLGGISAIFQLSYPGIVFQAVALTFGTLFCLLAAYKTGLIKVTDKFRLGVVAATGAIALVYFISIIIGFFGVKVPMIYDAGPVGIIFSLVVVGIAALNLVLDFDLIENAAAQGAPKYFEWYCGFALMVTLVWLYLEMLRLLAKMQRR